MYVYMCTYILTYKYIYVCVHRLLVLQICKANSSRSSKQVFISVSQLQALCLMDASSSIVVVPSWSLGIWQLKPNRWIRWPRRAHPTRRRPMCRRVSQPPLSSCGGNKGRLHAVCNFAVFAAYAASAPQATGLFLTYIRPIRGGPATAADMHRQTDQPNTASLQKLFSYIHMPPC